MSTTVKIFQSFEVSVGGVNKKGGSREVAQEITVDGTVHEVITTVVSAADPDDATVELLWSTGNGNLDTFDFLWFESDTDVLLQFRNTSGTDQYAVIAVAADIPFMLSADDLLGNDDGTAPLVDGTVTTMSQIDEISVQNNVATASTATVRLVLVD